MTALADGGWLGICFTAGMCVGGLLLALIARRRGHIRMTVELGDPPPSPDHVTPPK